MSGPTIVEQFRSLFTGYTANYVKHTPPFTLDDEGKMKAKFAGIAKYKSKSKYHPAPPVGSNDDDDVPLTIEQYRGHLNGDEGLAISSLFDTPECKNVCFFSVIDIDVYDVDYLEIIQRLYKYGYKFAPFFSKSGGLHIYFFYSKAEVAEKAVAEMKRIVERFGLNKIYQNDGKSRVEIFPAHTERTPGQHDKCLFLPFYNSGGEGGSRQKLITRDGALLSVKKAIPVIETMFTSVDAIKETTDALPYNDAPFCVQMLMLSGSMGANTGRNEFLFTAATYLKTKHADALTKEHIEEMNNDLPAPLEQREINGIFQSISTKDWQTAGRCKKEPVVSFCNKTLCRERQFGVGRSKNNMVSNVEFGKIVRMMAETPYYLWEARLSGTEEYKTLRIDGAENLMNQKVVQRVCIDTLNQLSITVKQTVWETTVNTSMANVEEVLVARETDTTEMSALRETFMRYLSSRQTRTEHSYKVNVKQVYYDTDGGTFYFKTEGFQDYLRTAKFILGRTNLREQLVQYGCVEGELKYTNAAKIEKTIKCWKKVEDDELRSLDTFYDDIMEADAGVIENNKLHKQDRNDSGTDDNRF
jgi:hypothetical protein